MTFSFRLVSIVLEIFAVFATQKLSVQSTRIFRKFQLAKMTLNKLSVEKVDVAGKRVLIR